MNKNYLVRIENINENLIGYITNENAKREIKNNYYALNDITFNPLTILGDLLFIANNNYNIDDNITNISIDKTLLFQAPYPIETCFNINVEHDYQYFSLLNTLKKIIVSGQKLTFEQAYRIGLFYNISLNYTFSYENEKKEYDNLTTYTPMVFGLNDLNKAFTIDTKNHIYICNCSSISEIVFSIFTYLILFDYHFFKCNHCQKYSATKIKQGTKKYCTRKNMLSLQEYENLSCEEVIPKLLDRIRRNKKNIYNYLYINDDDKIDSFLKGYYEIYKSVQSTPSAPNLLKLKKYIDDNSIINSKKKRG